MDTAEEAAEYDAMDHAAVNRRFCADLLALEPEPRRVVDVGTGTALIPVALCELHPRCSIVATDLAEHMLAVARDNLGRFAGRIELVRVDAKGSTLPSRAFDVVMSNSIVHHIPEPALFFAEVVRLCAPGGLLFVRDLERPRDEAGLQRLVETYAKDETARARGLFADSLRAALTVEEVVELVRPLGISGDAVARTSDRHWTMAVRR